MKYLFPFFITLLISFNVSSQGFSNKQGGNCFTLDVPDYMTITYELNDVAGLQYQNMSREAYLLVIEDSKDQLETVGIKFMNSREFLEHFMKDYKQDTKKRKESAITEFTSNGNSHSSVELTWKEEDVDFYMLITAVETTNHFYRIMCWTILENAEKLKSDFLMSSKSLKE